MKVLSVQYVALACLISQIQLAIGMNELSLLTRYAGMGFNILEANPEGDFFRGGINPGIKTTRFIFKHTYNDDRQVFYRGQPMAVPDQVVFHMSQSCVKTNVYNAYSGQTSYSRELSSSIETSAGFNYNLLSFKFSLSSAMREVQNRVERQSIVVVQNTTICNYGQARYQLTNALSGVDGFILTEEFKNAVRLLPSSYSAPEYTEFLDDWGTHLIETASLGTRYIDRRRLTYSQVYKYLNTYNRLGISTDVSASLKGYVSLDINVLDHTVNQMQNTNIGRHFTRYTIGSEEVPLPIHTELVPIIEALADELWNEDERPMIQQKKRHLNMALQDYARNKQAQIAGDPDLNIEVQWPDGQYSLVESASGCPSGWSSGWRYQDNEDDDNENHARPSNINSYIKLNLDRNIKTYYCTKTISGNSGFTWPRGRYCIAQYGESCPSGFFSGYRHWDDEDSNNENSLQLPVPDGNYDRNTRINYCCRSDGDVNKPILLPTRRSFILYRYGGTCQKVLGMNNPVELFIHFDDEDSNNENSCSGNRPDGRCDRNHEIYFCYYS